MCIREPQGPEPEEQHKHLSWVIIIFLVLGSIILIITGTFCFIKIKAFLTRQKHDDPAPFARWKLTTFHPTNYSVQDILCEYYMDTVRVLVSNSGAGVRFGKFFRDMANNTWIRHRCRNPTRVRGIRLGKKIKTQVSGEQ